MSNMLFGDYEPLRPKSSFKTITPWKMESTNIYPINSGNRLISIAGTGHRPDRLGNYANLDRSAKIVIPIIVSYLQQCHVLMSNKPTDFIEVISGFAQGWDTWLADAAIASGVCRLTAAIPCQNHPSKWPAKAQAHHADLLSKSNYIITITEHYTDHSMQDRNIWMTNNCNTLLACWDGTSGGTGNCVDYATKCNVNIVNIYDRVALALGLI